ncbi:MAG TPA: polysaccharide deacetylase family protein [Ruminiclostridium sp.]|nr:polysaccharide deacetylase family protein [Ruminiclostridium sp.]
METFKGAGTIQDRLNYLINKGFEIGNHTKTHVSLPTVKTADKMLEEVGGNQKLMEEYVPGYKFKAFSLPFGNATKDLKQYVIQGNYEGTEYKNSSIVLVGANPSPSPVSPKFNPLAIPRVRSTGQAKVECDLSWWLDTLSKGNSQYISDGNKDTVVVPASKKQNVDITKLNGKKLITY